MRWQANQIEATSPKTVAYAGPFYRLGEDASDTNDIDVRAFRGRRAGSTFKSTQPSRPYKNRRLHGLVI